MRHFYYLRKLLCWSSGLRCCYGTGDIQPRFSCSVPGWACCSRAAHSMAYPNSVPPLINHWTPAFPAFYVALAVPVGAWVASVETRVARPACVGSCRNAYNWVTHPWLVKFKFLFQSLLRRSREPEEQCVQDGATKLRGSNCSEPLPGIARPRLPSIYRRPKPVAVRSCNYALPRAGAEVDAADQSCCATAFHKS